MRLRDRIQLYGMMESLLGAGLPQSALARMPLSGPLRRVMAGMVEALRDGGLVSEAMARQRRVFSRVETALIAVGERTGSVERSARTLREMFEQRLALRNRLLTGLLYPAFTYAVAGPLLKVIDLAQASIAAGNGLDLNGWGAAITLRCLLWWGTPLLLWLLMRLGGGMLLGTRLVGAVLAAIPFLGGLLEEMNGASFWRTLGVCLSAGLGPIQGIRLAADSCGSGWHRSRLARMATLMEREGLTVAQAFAIVATRRETGGGLVSLVATAELAGSLDCQAMRLSDMLAQRVEASLHRLSVLLPLAVFLVLALYLAFQIVAAYGAMLSGTLEAMP